jgi:hypothetical protein
MPVHHSIHHLALSIAHTRHTYLGIVLGDSEFSASPKVRGDFRAVDDIFARHTGDIGTGTPDIFSLNHDRSHSLFGQGPGEVLACFAAAQHDDIIFFRVWHGCLHRFKDFQLILARLGLRSCEVVDLRIRRRCHRVFASRILRFTKPLLIQQYY